LLRIRAVPGSILGWETRYLGWGSSFSSVPLRNWSCGRVVK